MPDKTNLPVIPWSKDIARMDDDSLKARLKSLSVEAQADLVTSLDWDARLKVIRNSGAGRELVQGLPDEEVFLTVKGAEEGDALPVIDFTSPDQLRFILDMELWTGDRLDAESARQWLMKILACGEEKVIELFEHAEPELVTIMMSKLLTLIPNEEGVSVSQGLASIMPDEFFTILSSIPQETENIRLLLRIIRQWNRDRFYELLFDIYGKSGTEAEEEAFRWRNSRLEAKGLLEFEEAIEVYAYIGEGEAEDLADAALSAEREAHKDEEAEVAPVYPVALVEPGTLFYRTLVSIDDLPTQNRLRSEIAFSANRLLVADAERIGDINDMKASLNRLFSLSNVGLLFLSGGDTQRAEELIRSMPVKELFQIGFSRAVDLGSLARRIKSRWWPKCFRLLGAREDETLTAALKRIPQYYAPPDDQRPGLRDFITYDEIVKARRILEKIEVAAETLFVHLGVPAPHEAELETDSVFAGGLEAITMSNLLLTGFIHFALGRSFQIDQLTAQDIEEMFAEVLELSEPGRTRVRPEAIGPFRSWLEDRTGFEGQRLEILGDYLGTALRRFEDEIKGFSSAAEFDPRYMSSVILAPNKRG